MDEIHRKQLLDMAKKSIKYGLENNARLTIKPEEFDSVLREKKATFVTLHLNGALRGCIGSLSAHQSLIEDLSSNAYSAAFRDSRFPPLKESEFEQLRYNISILSQASPIPFTSEKELIAQLRPHVDGLMLTEGMNAGTFLPSVWEQLPDRELFLRHLKHKAGLNQDYWSDSITVERYEVDSFEG
tara:strand:+ start:11811 stop:12365 length:555 start_codon:yes stop_codon:yes gene_type:complete